MITDRLLTASLALTMAASANAQTHVYVDDDAPAGGTGLSWQSAFNDLHDAIELAKALGQNRGEIRIAGGTYSTRGSPFEVPLAVPGIKPLRLIGGYAGLSVLSTPNVRDTDIYKSILETDGSGYTLTFVSATILGGSNIRPAYTGQTSATTLDGIRFRGVTSASIISLDRQLSVSIRDCDFVSVQSAEGGSLKLNEMQAWVDRCLFVSNRMPSGFGGGAMVVTGGRVSVTDSDFFSNERIGSGGGAISLIGGNHSVVNCGFYDNRALEGGAIFANTESISIQQCEFFDNSTNTSNRRGGAIAATVYGTGPTSSIGSSDFSGNRATFGGAIYIDDESLPNGFLVASSNFLQNNSQYGGAVYQDPDSTATHWYQCDFLDNRANFGGAAWGVTRVEQCTFESNVAIDNGGAIDGQGKSIITDSQFMDCSAGNHGGAVFAASAIVLSEFFGNTAGQFGGAVYDAQRFVSVTVIDNRALRGGGAYDVAQVQGSTINENIGGGLRGRIGTIQDSEIKRNRGNDAVVVEHTDESMPLSIVSTSISDNERAALIIENPSQQHVLIDLCEISGNGNEGIRSLPSSTNAIHTIEIRTSAIVGNGHEAVWVRPNVNSSGNTLRITDSLLHSRTRSAIKADRGTDATFGGVTVLNDEPADTIDMGIECSLILESSIVLRNEEVSSIAFDGSDLVIVQSLIESGLLGISTLPTTNFKTIGDLIDSDPGFVSPEGPDGDPLTWQDNDYRLASGSEAIDNGSTLVFVSNQRISLSGPRILDDAGMPNRGFGINRVIDLGAYEFQGTTCSPDVNNDGSVDQRDFTAWIAAYNEMSRRADQNFDGSVTPTDYAAWVAAYFVGCP